MLLKTLMYASYRGLKKGVDMGKFNVMFVLGGPGAGKGTQCEKMVKDYGYTHLSAGDLLRAERAKPESKVGQLIEKHIVDGSIVPVEITCGLLEQAMVETIEKDSQKNTFLIDGFPRNKDNLDGWNKQMGEKTNLRCVLFFDCSEQVCVDRCLLRGQAGSGRSDDNMDSLKKRINTYNTSSYPIIEHYNQHGLVRKIDASQTAEQVFGDVKNVLSDLDK